MTAIIESLTRCAEVLRAAGYDVVVSDVLIGRRERGDLVAEVIIDAGGRLRLTVTSSLKPPRGQRVIRRGRRFRVLREWRQIVTVTTEWDRPEDLTDALAGAEQLAGVLPASQPTVTES